MRIGPPIFPSAMLAWVLFVSFITQVILFLFTFYSSSQYFLISMYCELLTKIHLHSGLPFYGCGENDHVFLQVLQLANWSHFAISL